MAEADQGGLGEAEATAEANDGKPFLPVRLQEPSGFLVDLGSAELGEVLDLLNSEEWWEFFEIHKSALHTSREPLIPSVVPRQHGAAQGSISARNETVTRGRAGISEVEPEPDRGLQHDEGPRTAWGHSDRGR